MTFDWLLQDLTVLTLSHLLIDPIRGRDASGLGNAPRGRQPDILEAADDAPVDGARGLDDVRGRQYRSDPGQGETRGSRDVDAGRK